MYIQEDRGLPFTLPKGYSGSAFQEPTPPPTEAPPPAPQEGEASPQAEAAEASEAVQTSAAEPAHSRGAEAPSTLAGLFGRVPLLSSLLPPPRRKKEGGLPEWAIVAFILFVLSDNREGDLLPLLLLLLLWD